jgi:hypothetical protein
MGLSFELRDPGGFGFLNEKTRSLIRLRVAVVQRVWLPRDLQPGRGPGKEIREEIGRLHLRANVTVRRPDGNAGRP